MPQHPSLCAALSLLPSLSQMLSDITKALAPVGMTLSQHIINRGGGLTCRRGGQETRDSESKQHGRRACPGVRRRVTHGHPRSAGSAAQCGIGREGGPEGRAGGAPPLCSRGAGRGSRAGTKAEAQQIDRREPGEGGHTPQKLWFFLSRPGRLCGKARFRLKVRGLPQAPLILASGLACTFIEPLCVQRRSLGARGPFLLQPGPWGAESVFSSRPTSLHYCSISVRGREVGVSGS